MASLCLLTQLATSIANATQTAIEDDLPEFATCTWQQIIERLTALHPSQNLCSLPIRFAGEFGACSSTCGWTRGCWRMSCRRKLEALEDCKNKHPNEQFICRHIEAAAGWCLIAEICPQEGTRCGRACRTRCKGPTSIETVRASCSPRCRRLYWENRWSAVCSPQALQGCYEQA